MKRSEVRKNKKKRWYKIPLIVLSVLVLIGGVWLLSIYNKAKTTVNEKMYQEVGSIDKAVSKKKVKDKEQLNVLIMGIDVSEGDSGRSDSMMVATLNPQEDSMKLISIPRDTRTEIVGKGFDDKINHAYSFGKEDMAIATVENFLDIEIDYHISLNMTGLQMLIDELGGVTVNSELAWQDGNYTFEKGPTELDGKKALAYVRMRKEDPSGDFGRAKRQRQVVEAMIKEGASIGSVNKIGSIIDILGDDNLKTSADFDDVKRLFTGYSGVRKNIENYQVQGQGQMIDGIYYYVVSEEERQNVHQMIMNN